MASARELWKAYWGPFDETDVEKRMPTALKNFWKRRAETGLKPELQYTPGDLDTVAIAAAHGTRRKLEDPESAWNLEGYLPPDPDTKTKIKDTT